MYRLGHRPHHKRFVYSLVLFIALGVVVAAVIVNFPRRDAAIINQAPAYTMSVGGSNEPHKTFDMKVFAFQLPADWKYMGRDPSTIYHPYQWQNTAGNAGAEVLAVYVDNIPINLAVNRLLPLAAENDHLVPGTVSDNCTNFTGSGKVPQDDVVAKWSGVNFICDMHNYERDVVGTGSAQAVNSVTLSGKTAGSHKFFFTYTDNNPQPDYNIFTDALSSFAVK